MIRLFSIIASDWRAMEIDNLAYRACHSALAQLVGNTSSKVG